jgi:hypothetical protein
VWVWRHVGDSIPDHVHNSFPDVLNYDFISSFSKQAIGHQAERIVDGESGLLT